MNHTQTPWIDSARVANQNPNDPQFWHKDIIKGGIRVVRCTGTSKEEAEANATFIVKAVNNHIEFVKLLNELK